MRSRPIATVAAAAALSSGLSVALTQAFSASAATSTPTQSQTNTILRDIDHKLGDVNSNLSDLRAGQRTVIKQLTSVQEKQVAANTTAAKTYNNLFFRTTWLNRNVSKYGYMGRIQQMLSAMCTLQAVTAHNFNYCTDNVSGGQPAP
jgi:arginyl-tRNA synthetase